MLLYKAQDSFLSASLANHTEVSSMPPLLESILPKVAVCFGKGTQQNISEGKIMTHESATWCFYVFDSYNLHTVCFLIKPVPTQMFLAHLNYRDIPKAYCQVGKQTDNNSNIMT